MGIFWVLRGQESFGTYLSKVSLKVSFEKCMKMYSCFKWLSLLLGLSLLPHKCYEVFCISSLQFGYRAILPHESMEYLLAWGLAGAQTGYGHLDTRPPLKWGDEQIETKLQQTRGEWTQEVTTLVLHITVSGYPVHLSVFHISLSSLYLLGILLSSSLSRFHQG